ncbi:P-loop containing nucleoside triphosphate hydrolase protein [Cyathus striatus]|nr:P-loop containing nucleoside triphosphate hydrolase protein [Cyathus striatus]
MEDIQPPAEPHTTEITPLTMSDILSLSRMDVAQELYTKHIPSDKALPSDFWNKFTKKEQLFGLKASLALLVASNFEKVPREFQLEATMALCTMKDALVDVGTGYGKTFCMIIPALLFPHHVTLVISPLKKLQEMQVLEFQAYGILALAINDETSNDNTLWKDINSGAYSVLIVQAEQFFINNGHWPKLSRLLHKPNFAKRIRFLFVDEVHFVYTAGIDLYGSKAFRPAWGYLSELRTKLGSNVAVAGLSGTLPQHIKGVVMQHLQFDDNRLYSIKLSCNCSNIAYATHEIIDQPSNYHNLDFILPNALPLGTTGRRQKGIVFHDSIESAIGAKNFQEWQLVPDLQGKGLIKTFFSLMSDEYLKETYDDFKDPNGRCLILHATEAASTGLDVRDVDWVIQYGVPREMTMALQRAGHCGHDGITLAIFVLMFESWAKKVDLSTVLEDEKLADNVQRSLDPDCPLCGEIMEKTKKQDRTGISILKLIQNSGACLREIYAKYNNDTSDNALSFTGPYCCNSSVHPQTLDFSFYFPGKLLYEDQHTDIIYYGSPSDPSRHIYFAPTGEKCSSPTKWRYETWKKDKFCSIRPPHLILSDKALDTIMKINPPEVVNYQQVTLSIAESLDWENKYARMIFDIIHEFNEEVGHLHEED